MSSLATKRSLIYWVFIISFLMGGGPIFASELTISAFLHNVLDGLAALGVIVAAVFAFRAYRSTGSPLLAIVTITLACTAALELLHEVADSGWLSSLLVSELQDFMPWSWHAARVFLAIGLLAAALHASRDNFGSETKPDKFPAPRLVAALLFVALPVTVYGLLTVSLPSIYYSSLGLLRVPELISGSVFLLALIIFVRKGNWRTDSYGHWINLALVASINAQFFCMAFSQEFLDSSFGAAHALKVLSYFALAYGFAVRHQATARIEDEEKNKPRGLSLGVKVALLCGFIGFICVIPVAIMSAGNLHQIAANNGMENLSSAADGTGRALNDQRRRVDSDLNYLASAKVMVALERAKQNGGFDEITGRDREELIGSLSRMGQNLLISDPQYLSLAYFDAETGQVIVRVEQFADSTLSARNRPALQASETALAEKIMTGAKTSAAIRSNIFMLEDEGAADPNVPVEGAAVALYSSDTDAITGIMVAHTNVSGALVAKPLPNVDTTLYVVNSRGEFLVNPDPERELTATSSGAPLAIDFPGREFTESADPGVINGFIHQAASGEEFLVGFSRDQASPISGEPLLYIYTGSRDQMEAMATSVGEDLQRIAQFNLLLAIIIGWFFARRFAKPVQAISTAAVNFGRSGIVTELPTEGRDEIGMLAKSVSEMMEEVAAQRQRLGLLAAAVESAVNSTVITSIDGYIRYVNPQYERYAGINGAGVLGKNVLELEEFKANRNILSKQPEQKGDEMVWVGEMRVKRADGRYHDEAVTISPIRNAAGKVINQSMIIEDITERRQMERNIVRKTDELTRSNRDLEQFAYVASHDLKAPLRAIEVIVGWLKDDLGDYDEGDVHENLGLLEQRTTRLARLLDDLLAYSRAGRKIGGVKVTNTKDLVEDVATLVAPPAGFIIEADDSLPTITTHHAPLETVLRNLISNAVKHAPVPEEGHVRIYAVDRKDQVEFSVEDNGAGIPQEYADKVFKMFQTLQARDEKEGSGMGLAIVQRIIDWQGGKIWFEEGPDGKGVVFRFTWSKKATEMPEFEHDHESESEGGTMELKALSSDEEVVPAEENVEEAAKEPTEEAS
jgi:PAS domain S-box-containing protein